MTLSALFSRTFYDTNYYIPSYCDYTNFEFLTKARKSGISLDSIRVIYLMNPSSNGIVLHHERTTIAMNPSASLGDEGWKYHVFTIDNPDPKLSNSYDFDFGNSPETLPFKEHLNKILFLESSGQDVPLSEKNEKLKDYKVYVCPTSAFLLTDGYGFMMPSPYYTETSVWSVPRVLERLARNLNDRGSAHLFKQFLPLFC